MKPLAMITGASSGIGRELATVAAADGYDLILVARREDKLREVAQACEVQHGTKTKILSADLSREPHWDLVSDCMTASADRLEVMVNNAGFGGSGRIVDLEWNKQKDMINVNITALTYLSRHAARLMEQRNTGYIMNVASTAAFLPGPLMSVYYASKAYVLHFSEGLAGEMKGTGVVVSALCPGPTESEFLVASDIERPYFFKGPVPTSQDVAVWSWSAMKRGKIVAVHSWKNVILTQSLRFMPRALMRTTTRYLNRPE
ncbi:MAG: SDR family oxidoreductase [Verrucomicrobiota bacterium]